MRTKAGYTLVEMLLCLALVVVLSFISVTAVRINPGERTYLEKIRQLINETHQAAILSGEDQTIQFTREAVINPYHTLNLDGAYMLEEGAFTYKGNGHIQKGGTVRFCHHHCYDIIFNVGNGAWRIEKV